MARSKSLHFVQKTYTIQQPNDSNTMVVEDQIDLALELSNTLGREIRQGNTFRVVGTQAHLHPATGDVDMGYAMALEAFYVPTTGHSRKAWNQVFKQWKRQKQLAGKVGNSVRYDDMEFAYNSEQITSRTSSIYGQGMGDTSLENLTLLGISTAGSDFALQDYYNSAYKTPQPSVDHFTNATIKDPKQGTTPFPSTQSLKMSAALSAGLDASTTPDSFGFGLAMSDFEFFPADNHVNVMCGLFYLKGYVTPPDTALQAADTLSLTVTIAVEGWTPLVYKPRRKIMRKRRKTTRKPRRSYRRSYTGRKRG